MITISICLIIYEANLKRHFVLYLDKLLNLLSCFTISYKRHKLFINNNFNFYTELIYKSKNQYQLFLGLIFQSKYSGKVYYDLLPEA
jgi:hypothetical protein